jgi:hypothetical protein
MSGSERQQKIVKADNLLNTALVEKGIDVSKTEKSLMILLEIYDKDIETADSIVEKAMNIISGYNDKAYKDFPSYIGNVYKKMEVRDSFNDLQDMFCFQKAIELISASCVYSEQIEHVVENINNPEDGNKGKIITDKKETQIIVSQNKLDGAFAKKDIEVLNTRGSFDILFDLFEDDKNTKNASQVVQKAVQFILRYDKQENGDFSKYIAEKFQKINPDEFSKINPKGLTMSELDENQKQEKYKLKMLKEIVINNQAIILIGASCVYGERIEAFLDVSQNKKVKEDKFHPDFFWPKLDNTKNNRNLDNPEI